MQIIMVAAIACHGNQSRNWQTGNKISLVRNSTSSQNQSSDKFIQKNPSLKQISQRHWRVTS
jgi:hypothetical protein